MRDKKTVARARTEEAKRRSRCKVCERKRRLARMSERWVQVAARLKKNHGSKLTAAELKDGLGEPETCHICGGGLTWEDASVDHIEPFSRTKKTEIGGLAWAHLLCNQCKASMSLGEFLVLIRKILEYHTKIGNCDSRSPKQEDSNADRKTTRGEAGK